MALSAITCQKIVSLVKRASARSFFRRGAIRRRLQGATSGQLAVSISPQTIKANLLWGISTAPALLRRFPTSIILGVSIDKSYGLRYAREVE
jgi:hypothetical protein